MNESVIANSEHGVHQPWCTIDFLGVMSVWYW